MSGMYLIVCSRIRKSKGATPVAAVLLPEIARQVQQNSHVTSKHEQGPEQDAQALPAALSVLSNLSLFGGSDESMLFLMPP